MILQHTIVYFLGRGLPALLTFLALAWVSRLLDPQAYGIYSVAVATAGTLNVLLFQWLRFGLLRLGPKGRAEILQLNVTLVRTFVLTLAVLWTVVVVAAGLGLAIEVVGHEPVAYVLTVAALLSVQASYELAQDYFRSVLRPKIYALNAAVKATVFFFLAVLLAWNGFGEHGLLLALIVAFLVPTCRVLSKALRIFQLGTVNRNTLGRVWRYGVPLSAAVSLGFLVNYSDRLVITYLLDATATGQYSMSGDLAHNAIVLPLSIVNLASYPIIVQTFERRGEEAAVSAMRSTGTALLGLGLPFVVLFAACSDQLAKMLLGAAFQEAAKSLFPLIALGAFFAGMKSFYFDLGFQIREKPQLQIPIMLIALAVNVVLNFLLIPPFGVRGAAYATVAAYGTGAVLSWYFSRRQLPVPAPQGLITLALLNLGFYLVLWLAPDYQTQWPWVIQTSVLGMVYAALIMRANLVRSADLRTQLTRGGVR